ncbi:MAG: DNA gyrase subunit A, partial [Pseudomonadota bacterium]
LTFMPGPDFPTGGIIIDEAATILEAYQTGRGGFRVRAKWAVEERPRGGYIIVVTEIPYQVQKSKLIEKIADLMSARKLPLLGDVRDESAEDIRLVLEPKSRTVDAALLMESLFKTCDLESRFSLNMNVLGPNQVPGVMDLKAVLLAFLDHRREVLLRRSRFRLGKIEHRLEILAGYLIAYLNLDEVIRIIREEDEPKQELMATFELSDVQAEAILNMRLRSLRKLEEMEIKKENKALKQERKDLKELIGSADLQDKKIAGELRDIRDRFGAKAPGGARRTAFASPPEFDVDPFEVLVEREPITVVCSEKGWIRSLKGHQEFQPDTKYKEGDAGRFWLPAETTDKLILFASNGRFYTLACDRLPGGRGMGEPIRLMIDLANEDEIIAMMVHDPARELLVASSSGHGFRVPEAEVVASKRGGKQVLNLIEGAEARVCVPVVGDTLAVIGDTRKLLAFPLEDLPVMARGRGVTLQKYADGGLIDAAPFTLKDGLSVDIGAGKVRTFADMKSYVAGRGGRGKLAPKGFPRSNRFRQAL